MATRPSITSVGSNSNINADKLNANLIALQEAIVGCVGRGGVGETPNTITGNLDINNNRIINVSDPVNSGDVVTKNHGDTYYGGAAVIQAEASAVSAAASEAAALTYKSSAESSATAAASSETNAAASELKCSEYSSIGFSTAGSYDFGSVADATVLFPTDFGLIV